MEEIIKEHYPSLPNELKEHIQQVVFGGGAERVVADQPLQNVQKDAFVVEVLLVLLRIESLDMFMTNIKHNMEISLGRAKDIARQAEQEIFVPVRTLLLEHAPKGESEHIAGDGVMHKSAPQAQVAPKSLEVPSAPAQQPRTAPQTPERNEIHNDIPAPPPQAPTPASHEQILNPPKGADDIFKKRLEVSVHAPTEQEQLGEKKPANVSPSSPEQIANDPYKESI